MWRRQREVEEKREFVRGDKFAGFACQHRQHIGRLEVRTGRPGTHEVFGGGGGFREPVIFDKNERRHVERSTDTKIIIKPARRRPVGHRQSLRVFGNAQSQMPFADARGGVAVLLEQPGHRQPVGGDERRAVTVQHAILEMTAPVVATGENTVAARRADRRRGMCVRERHPLSRQPVEVRRGDLATVRIQAMHVAIAEIIT